MRWLTDRDITPHIPVWDKSRQTNGRFTRDDFSYHSATSAYLGPAGKAADLNRQYRAASLLPSSQTPACLLRPQCTIGPMRKVTRDIDEEVRARVRALADTEAFQQSRRERKKVDAVCPHEADPKGLGRRPRRGSARRYRPELEKACQICRTITAEGAKLCCVCLARLEYRISAPIPQR